MKLRVSIFVWSALSALWFLSISITSIAFAQPAATPATLRSQAVLGSRQGSKTLESIPAQRDLLVADCGGQYLTASLSGRGGARFGVFGFVGARGALGLAGRDGCMVEDVLSLGEPPVLLVLFSLDRFMMGNGERRYSIVTLDASSLNEQSRYDFPVPQERVPRIVRTTSGRSAYVLFESRKPGASAVSYSRIDSATLQMRPAVGLSDSVLEALIWSRGVTVDDGGAFRIDGRLVTVESVTSTVGPNSLTDSLTVSSLLPRTVGRFGPGFMEVSRVAEIPGMILYVAGSIPDTEGFQDGWVVAYDPGSRSILSSFKTSLWLRGLGGESESRSAHLSPNGSVVVVEVYGANSASMGQPSERAKTGELIAFDRRTGVVLGRLQIALGPTGQGQVVRFSSDGRTLLYATSDKIHLIDVASMTASSVLDLPPGFLAVKAVFAGDSPR